MPGPTFTRDEEALISRIRVQDRNRVDRLVQGLIWLAISAVLFFYGFFQKLEVCMFMGYGISFYLLCRFVYYQNKPGWRLAPIIEKYEAACDENQPDAPEQERPH